MCTFNYGEFAIIKEKSGLNNFKISVKEWVARTGAIGLTAKTGRYGGTYAGHRGGQARCEVWITQNLSCGWAWGLWAATLRGRY